MSAGKIIDGLKDAIAGDLSGVTIDGQMWVRLPPDYKIVPVRPTEAMLGAGWGVFRSALGGASSIYAAMIAASP